jgi:hypothetical protein
MRRPLAAAGIAVALLGAATPTAAAAVPAEPAGPAVVTMEPSSLAGVLGDRVPVRATVANPGSAATGRLVAHLDVVSLHEDVYVDPEDWSADRSVDLGPLDPGGRTTVMWTLRYVDAGEFDVYVVLLPTAPSTGADPLAVSPAVRLAVASRQTLDPGGSLLVVTAVPLLVGLLGAGSRLRRKARKRRQGSSRQRGPPRPPDGAAQLRQPT